VITGVQREMAWNKFKKETVKNPKLNKIAQEVKQMTAKFPLP
jgi:hypothetical protein